MWIFNKDDIKSIWKFFENEPQQCIISNEINNDIDSGQLDLPFSDSNECFPYSTLKPRPWYLKHVLKSIFQFVRFLSNSRWCIESNFKLQPIHCEWIHLSYRLTYGIHFLVQVSDIAHIKLTIIWIDYRIFTLFINKMFTIYNQIFIKH